LNKDELVEGMNSIVAHHDKWQRRIDARFVLDALFFGYRVVDCSA